MLQPRRTRNEDPPHHPGTPHRQGWIYTTAQPNTSTTQPWQVRGGEAITVARHFGGRDELRAVDENARFWNDCDDSSRCWIDGWEDCRMGTCDLLRRGLYVCTSHPIQGLFKVAGVAGGLSWADAGVLASDCLTATVSIGVQRWCAYSSSAPRGAYNTGGIVRVPKQAWTSAERFRRPTGNGRYSTGRNSRAEERVSGAAVRY